MLFTWKDDRWHCDGRPIHAGTVMDLIGGGGSRMRVRIESENHGRTLRAYTRLNGLTFTHKVDCEIEVAGSVGALCWPEEIVIVSPE